MIYIKLSTMEYPRHPGDIELDPDGPDDYAPVAETERPLSTIEKKVVEIAPELTENGWERRWSFVDRTPEEIAELTPPEDRASEPPDVIP